MRREIFCMAGLALCLCLSAGPAASAPDKAKPAEYQVFKLGEVVVTDDRHSGNLGATVTRFTAEDIEATHSQTVPEALSYIPGVTVTSGFKNEPDIRIHGFQQYEALILIDGVPYYETNYGKLNLNQLPADMIARIDVVKGAPSVLYGAGAMGGVINIITKNAGDKPTVTATGEMGNDGRYRLSASHGNTVGKFKYWLSASRQEADAWRLSDGFTPRAGNIVRKPGGTSKAVLEDGGARNNSDLSRTSLWGKAGFDLGTHGKYYLSTYLTDSSWGFPVSTEEVMIYTSRPAFSRFSRMDKYRDWGLDLSGEQAVSSKFRVKSKLFYHKHEDDLVSYSDQTFSQIIGTSTYQDYLMGWALSTDWDVSSNDNLRFAFHFRGDSHQERGDAYLPFAESFSYTGSLALENEWRPLTGLSLVVGVGYDWFEVDKAQANVTDKNGALVSTDDLATGGVKDAVNPMIAASYTFKDKTKLYGSVAGKTRFPTLQQLFSSKGGNTDLAPQKSTNYTLGVSRPLCKWANGNASVFHYDIKDRISRDAPYPDALYRNYAQVTIWGFELAADATLAKGLKARLGYTFLSAKDESDQSVTDDVIGVPQHKIDVGVDYVIPRLGARLHLEGLFMAEQWTQLPTAATPTTEARQVSGYVVVNFRVSQPIGKNVEAFAYVSNLMDYDYESENGFPGPGRNFWFGIKTTF